MANFSVRKLDDDVYRKLRLRAAKHGLSMEEEARRIIARAVLSPENIGDLFVKNFGPENGVDLDLTGHRQPHEPVDFG